MTRYAGFLLSLTVLLPASAQESHFFTGRYHCGGLWRDFEFRVMPVMGLLGVVDPDLAAQNLGALEDSVKVIENFRAK